MFTTSTAQGSRSYQEDRHFTLTGEYGTILAVFDGHSGEDCAAWLNENLPGILDDELGDQYNLPVHDLDDHIHDLNRGTPNPATALKRAFQRAAKKTNFFPSGAAASVVFIPNDQKLAYVAILGDAPVVARLADGSLHVSPEHNVRTNLEERKAAEERGGFYGGGYICTRWNGPGLQMSRAFGDASLGSILSREPEIYQIELGPWLLVGSDGLFDPAHQNAEEAVQVLSQIIEEGADAQALVNCALAVPTGDNVTAILWRRDAA